jgi:hypothetical protein
MKMAMRNMLKASPIKLQRGLAYRGQLNVDRGQ